MFSEHKNQGSVAIGAFYFRRIIRLYPVLFVYVVAMSVLVLLRGQKVPNIEIFSIFLYFVNYLRSWQEYYHTVPVMPLGTLWSLAVEEHFYLLFPFVFVFLKGNRRRVLIFTVAVTIGAFVVRCAYLFAWPTIWNTDYIYRLSETRADSIAAGVALACMCELPSRDSLIKAASSNAGIIAGITMLLASYASSNAIFKDTIRYDLRNFFCFFLVAYVVFGERAAPAQRIFNWKPIAWVGIISYSLYIWHGMMHEVFEPLGLRGAKGGTAMLAATIACAVASYYVVERPCLKLKHLWK